MPSHHPHTTLSRLYKPQTASSQKRSLRPQLPNIVDLATFAHVHQQVDRILIRYIDYPRVNAVVPSAGVRLRLDCDEAIGLPANNAHARIHFAHIALRRIAAHSGIQAGPLHYVTITPATCAVRFGDEGGLSAKQRARLRRGGPTTCFRLCRIQDLARQALDTIPFIGMVEAVMFRRWGPEGPFYGDWISWHCHLITWGCPRPALQAALKPLRKKHRSMVPWNSVANIQDFTYDQLEQKVAYSLKSPQKAARVGTFQKAWTSPTTGEVRPPGRHVTKDWMRPGDRVRMLDILANHTLDRLLFGNGAGSLLANSICDEALRPLRREEELWEAQRRHQLAHFEVPPYGRRPQF